MKRETLQDCMVDLETLGTESDAVVVSIGAVFFSKDKIDKEGFYAVLDREAQVKAGRKLNPRTLDWWLQQSEEAREVFKLPAKPVLEVLDEFTEYLGDGNIQLWGNGADFDNVILGSLYQSFGIKQPWSHGRNRCFRTLKNLTNVTSLPPRLGTHHNALHDAIYQAQCAQVYLKGTIK